MIKKIWGSIKAAGSLIKIILEPVSKFVSSVVNFVLLLAVYFIGIAIVSIFAKIFRKHFLDLKKQNRKSNWHEHKLAKQPIDQYYRTF